MIIVQVVKMKESSGNIQFFGRAFNKITKESLDYCYAETKNGMSIDECLKMVWFEVGFLARFFGIPNSEIKIYTLGGYEQEFIVKQISINKTKESL